MEFDDVINEHLELRRRNARLEQSLPLERYRSDVTTRNHLVNGRPEAVSEETQGFPQSWPAPSEPDRNRDADRSLLWDVSPTFDWGD